MPHRAEHDMGAPESSSPRSPTRTMQSIRAHPYKRASLAISEAWSAEHPHVQDLYTRDPAEHLVRRTKRRHQHNAMDLYTMMEPGRRYTRKRLTSYHSQPFERFTHVDIDPTAICDYPLLWPTVPAPPAMPTTSMPTSTPHGFDSAGYCLYPPSALPFAPPAPFMTAIHLPPWPDYPAPRRVVDHLADVDLTSLDELASRYADVDPSTGTGHLSRDVNAEIDVDRVLAHTTLRDTASRYRDERIDGVAGILAQTSISKT
jgi:hypothetical protein